MVNVIAGRHVPCESSEKDSHETIENLQRLSNLKNLKYFKQFKELKKTWLMIFDSEINAHFKKENISYWLGRPGRP